MDEREPPSRSQGWQPLDPEPRPPFHEHRLQLHWAAQLIGAFGEARVEVQPDASHTSMEWDPAQRGLLGMPSREGLRLGLCLPTPGFYFRDPDDGIRSRLGLSGQTVSSCIEWIERCVEDSTGDAASRPLVLPEYAMPDHPVASGAEFGEFDPKLCAQITGWFADAASVLEELRSRLPGAGELRCWPHHFDIATLWVLDPHGGNPEKARSVGSGMVLGDEAVAEPYWYCNPWPRPTTGELPPLAGRGQWHTKGWVGALLRAGDLPEDGAEQAEQVRIFFDSALEANRALLGHHRV